MVVQKIIHKTSKTYIVMDTIFDNPTPGTLADYVLLKDYYRNREVNEADRDMKVTLYHHFNFLLTEKLNNRGNLKCAYCGKDKLIIQPVGL